MITVKIDAGLLEKIKNARYEPSDASTAHNGRYVVTLTREEHSAILSTAQPQPEVTDDQRKAALDDLNDWVSNDKIEVNINDECLIMPETIRTIRAALSAAPVQEVTVEKIRTDIHKLMPNYLQEGIGTSMGDVITVLLTVMQMNGLRIVRGEEEKS